MTFRTGIALSAVAAVLALPQAAEARPATPSTQQQLDEAHQEIAELRAALAELKARMDRQETASTDAAAQAQAANARADQALAQANTASAAAAAADTKASKPAAVPEAVKWAADTKISGRMYYNASAISADDAAGNQVRKDGGFEIKRFYLGVDHKFNDTFSGNLTTDINAATGSGAQLYVKKAYLQAKFSKALTVRVGAADTPWVPYVEGVNGYRHIEKVITDLGGYGTSSDWGVHVLGDLADGLVSYQVSAVNGAGYKTVKATKTIDLEGRLSLNYKGFNAAVGGYTGKLGNDVSGGPAYRTATRFDALLAYKGKLADMPFTIGGEYFTAKNWKILAASAEDSAAGYSLFASLAPVDKWSVFGGYNWAQTKRKTQADSSLRPTDEFFNLGIQYSPAKIVDFALVYKRDDGSNGITYGNLASGQATRDEFGLYGQFRF